MPPDWPPEADALLGTDFDFVIAARICRPLVDVRDRRAELAIPDFDPPPDYDPTVLMYTMWGLAPDAWVSAAVGKGLSKVGDERRRFGIPAYGTGNRFPARYPDPSPEMIAQLGTKSDAEVAEFWSVSYSYVRNLRIRLGIPPCRCSRRRCSPRPKVSRPLSEIPELGERPDGELAKLWGVSRQRVHQLRKERGIPSYRVSRKKP